MMRISEIEAFARQLAAEVFVRSMLQDVRVAPYRDASDEEALAVTLVLNEADTAEVDPRKRSEFALRLIDMLVAGQDPRFPYVRLTTAEDLALEAPRG